MSGRAKATAFSVTALVLCMAGALVALTRIDNVAPSAGDDDPLYLSSPAAVRRLALGHNGLAANYYWTRAVQYYGSKRLQRAQEYPLLYPLLKLATEMDPKLLPAYDFGSIFLSAPRPFGAGMPDEAAALVENGIKHNPESWRLYLQLGFIHYKERKDFAAAQSAFARGAEVPGAPPAMQSLAAIAAQQRGDNDAARALWTAILESSETETVRQAAIKHLVALDVDAAVPELERLILEFQSRNGRLPGNWAEMVAAGWLRGIPRDPTGHVYVLTDDGHVFVEDPRVLPYITRGLPPGYEDEQNSLRTR